MDYRQRCLRRIRTTFTTGLAIFQPDRGLSWFQPELDCYNTLIKATAMLIFCPNCSNALTISKADASTRFPMGVNRFECRTCPYEAPLDREWFESTNLKQKEVDDIFGGAEEFANADSVATQCPAEACNGERAYFFQLQIRSADEPMTTFLKCTSCGARWREN
ncbi:unnamed protein product [Penicillium salamii]|uniref:DNA-directed RNA polymerase III subunit RPC10 n=1 Tax=Penicillium salamii TaxID=1612424 RepID=A0A9W4I6Y6_9EURO|nr:unnamed protein product [Penicillium salamii]CAG8063673.1 unnamed protein product [Penicillium salamii]CAG8195797.1 unnamed protein product [Penicillium salamii]CAG8212869.1 unnamed protein product [Penicillium salamii]CAG8230059.1 unnamed protein product [Penicillium salamii]